MLDRTRFSRAAAERGGNNLNAFEDFCTENGSSQGQNLASTGLFVPSSLDSGLTLFLAQVLAEHTVEYDPFIESQHASRN